MQTIDLNCDLGEGFPDDAQLIPLVSSVNVACGGHAGDERTIRQAVRLAVRYDVNLGAHPGYEDREHFGRRVVDLPPDAVRDLVLRQVRRLQAVAQSEQARLRHVKPHGALYHAADRNAATADAVVAAVATVDQSLFVVGPSGGQLAAATQRAGLRFVAEGFVDRGYQADGTLVPRDQPGAMIEDEAAAAKQAVGIVLDGRVTAVDGQSIELRAQTLCVHGDGAKALPVLRALRRQLSESDIAVWPFGIEDE